METLEGRHLLTTFVVNALGDLDDGDPNNDQTTLREAVNRANANPDEDLITFNLTDRTITLQSGELSLNRNVKIVGPGAGALVISGNNAMRVFKVNPGVTAEISELTIFNGKHGSEGGGISNEGTLTLIDSVIEENRVVVTIPNGLARGGGLNNYGAGATLNIVRSIIRGNQLNKISDSEAGIAWGAGVYNSAGTVNIIDSTIESNFISAIDFGPFDNTTLGGGICNRDGGSVTIRGSLIHDNAADSGSGIANVNSSSLRLDNSTISNNGWKSGSSTVVHSGITYPLTKKGGGIFNLGNLTITDSTIAFNTAELDGAGIYNFSNIESIRNTIVAENYQARGPLGERLYKSDLVNDIAGGNYARVESAQFNLIGNTSGLNTLAFIDDGANSILDVDAQLAPLADNGGLTRTHALLATSPAIDKGSSDRFIDQRGFPVMDLPSANNVVSARDIGAYELQRIASSPWQSRVTGASQFGPEAATVFGVGFDVPNSTVQKEPAFFGFEFDTGPQSVGGIEEGLVGDKYGGELRTDLAGRFGIEYGYYVESGSVDADYLGSLQYSINENGNGPIAIDTTLAFDEGSLYTMSPRIGAYADLVLKLDASIGATACFIWCAGSNLPFGFDQTIPLFSINRQD